MTSSEHYEHISRVAQKDAISNFGSNENGLNGGEPFVLLFGSITFGPPAGKKEIEV